MGSKINDRLLKARASARSNPYLMRILQDKELRDNAIAAIASSRAAYDRVSSGKSANKLLDDKKLRKELKHTQSALADIRDSLNAKPKKKRKVFRRLLTVGVIGGAIALATNEGLRGKVLDKLFGAEEEFEYASTTTNGANGTPQTTPSQPTQTS